MLSLRYSIMHVHILVYYVRVCIYNRFDRTNWVLPMQPPIQFVSVHGLLCLKDLKRNWKCQPQGRSNSIHHLQPSIGLGTTGGATATLLKSPKAVLLFPWKEGLGSWKRSNSWYVQRFGQVATIRLMALTPWRFDDHRWLYASEVLSLENQITWE